MRAPGVESMLELSPPESMSAQARANPLAEYFLKNRERMIHKWHHYFEIYHRHLARFRSRSPVLLEIGVFQGGSLKMWREYFGPGVKIIGVDVEPRCKQFEDDSTTILIGDQSDPAFLADVRKRYPYIDIIIDDGGHTMLQQITTLGELYGHVQPNGIYICEDVHTAYMPKWGGGLRREGTFIEFSKALIDAMHAWYFVPKGEELDVHTTGTYGLSFYDSMVVIEKRPISKPLVSVTGKAAY